MRAARWPGSSLRGAGGLTAEWSTAVDGGVVEATSYAYDNAHRLTSACYGAARCAPGAAAAERYDYGYDVVGNRTSRSVTTATGKATTTATYDAGDQLTRETTAVTGTLTGVPDVEAGTRAFTYDAEGNLTSDGEETYEYHLDRTLASATSDGVDTAYVYDAAGMRLSSTSTDAGGATGSTAWSWDVNGALPTIATETRTGTDGAGTTSFPYAPDGSPLGLAEGDDAFSSYVRDWLGGTSAVVSATGGTQRSYDYDPFGAARGDLEAGGERLAEDAPANPLQFAERRVHLRRGARKGEEPGPVRHRAAERQGCGGPGRRPCDVLPRGGDARCGRRPGEEVVR